MFAGQIQPARAGIRADNRNAQFRRDALGARLGHRVDQAFPKRGRCLVDTPELRVEVVDMDRHRVDKVLVTPVRGEAEED